jgi:ribosome-binding ATPase YchF (GTP1/OBG family)
MKIAVIGLENFPLGKKKLPDERLERLKEILHPPKLTYIEIEFTGEDKLKDADGILCEEGSKLNLIISDLEVIENRLLKLEKCPEYDLFLRCKENLEKENLLSEITLSEAEVKILSSYNLSTLKPLTFLNKDNLPSIPEIIQKVYSDCGMICFYTFNEKELRSWQIKKGRTVYEAAGVIHSDIQKGFIKAEVLSYEDLIESGGINQARSKGLIRLEDKEYIVKDADMIKIRFSL